MLSEPLVGLVLPLRGSRPPDQLIDFFGDYEMRSPNQNQKRSRGRLVCGTSHQFVLMKFPSGSFWRSYGYDARSRARRPLRGTCGVCGPFLSVLIVGAPVVNAPSVVFDSSGRV